MIKGLLFDFDDTIGHRNLYTYRTFEYLLDSYCSFSDPYERECILQDCMLWDMKGNYRKSFVLENLERKYGLQLPIEDMHAWWLENQQKFTVPFAGVEDVLEKLHADYRMALVTNGDDRSQRKKISRTGLMSYFDCIVTSGQIGHKKPQKEIYQAALTALGIEAEEALFIGDTFSTDIIGAHRLGIKVVWITPYDYPCSLEDLVQLRHIDQLPDYLKG